MGIRITVRKYKDYIRAMLKANWTVKKKIIKGIREAKEFYKIDSITKVDIKKLVKCTVCPNNCRFECPTLEAARKETYAPATKSRMAYYLERGYVDMNDLDFAEIIYACTNCNGCQNWCPKEISVGDLLRDVRVDLIDRKIYLPKVKEFLDNLKSQGTVFSKDIFTSNPSISINMEKPQVLYFIGCVSAEKHIESVSATISILKHVGVNFTTITDKRICCGGPLFTLGFRQEFRAFAEKNLTMFKESGATTIICDCPMCCYTIGTVYKKVGLKHKYKVLTTIQYFRELVDKGILNPNKEVNMVITYHDPCYVSRRLEKDEKLDSARYLLSKIKGIVLKEPFLHGKETQCCGRGGVSHVHHSTLSERMMIKRFNELKRTGADYIISSCPSCELAFEIANQKDNIKIMDISEVLKQSLEIKEN